MISVLSMLAGTAGLVWFILPVFTGRIVNIGNVTGSVVSLCLLLYGAHREKLHTLLLRGWQSSIPVRVLLVMAGGFLAAVALTAFLLTCMMIREACRKPSRDAVVIVLGCEVKGEQPSRMLLGRMDTAVRFLRENADTICVVSGGKGENESVSEAVCMFRYMTACGIEPSRILLEDRSTSTRENLLFTSEILRKNGLKTEVAIVTNEFHACRANLIARACGLHPGIIAAGTPWWLFPTFYVRELYGILYQLLL